MATRGVMGASLSEKKMHYPVMTERQLALRWKISLKTLRGWRLASTAKGQFRTSCFNTSVTTWMTQKRGTRPR
jgi:hypothetical protein